MNESLKKSPSNGCENPVSFEEQQQKIYEIRRLLGPLSGNLSVYCSDASIVRYLRARNWNVKKASNMLKESLKWRSQFKPEEIKWLLYMIGLEDVAHEAETGKIYRTNYIDKDGRTVLVKRPSRQNSKSAKGQMKYLVYCMENAVLNLPSDQEQMVWLIDFQGFNLSHISLKLTRETAYVLQDHYPERLGLAILYNPPKFFEPFWTVVKPFLEQKTVTKVKFVYSDDLNTQKVMEDYFEMEKLESAFGGKDNTSFEINKYAERMKKDDKKLPSIWKGSSPSLSLSEQALLNTPVEPLNLDSSSDSSDYEKMESDPSGKIAPEGLSLSQVMAVTAGNGRCSAPT